MDTTKINSFLSSKGKYFPDDKIGIIRDQLEKIDDKKFITINNMKLKDPTTAIILAAVLPGADRLYLGQTGLGILKLCTCGVFGIWWIIDLFSIGKIAKEINFQNFTQIAS